jgi:hypothetical protein
MESTTYQWKSPALKLITATKKLVYSSACERLYGKFSGDETTIGTRYWTDTSYFESWMILKRKLVEILVLGYFCTISVYKQCISGKSDCKKRGVTVNWKIQEPNYFWSEEGRSICKTPQFILCSADLWYFINNVELVVADLLHRGLIPHPHPHCTYGSVLTARAMAISSIPAWQKAFMTSLGMLQSDITHPWSWRLRFHLVHPHSVRATFFSAGSLPLPLAFARSSIQLQWGVMSPESFEYSWSVSCSLGMGDIALSMPYTIWEVC